VPSRRAQVLQTIHLFASNDFPAPLNLPEGQGDQWTLGLAFLEGHMATLFSIVFTGIFIAFIVAAVLGHALLIGAYVRPFFARLTIAKPAPLPSQLQPAC
jgi:predicted cupin superfamily sugar epimerase